MVNRVMLAYRRSAPPDFGWHIVRYRFHAQESKMPITQTLRMAIVDCLETVPGIDEPDGRRTLIAQAELDSELARRITYGGSTRSFCALLVSDLEEYGRLDDGYHALEAVIEAAREFMDEDGVRECDTILMDLRLQLKLAGAADLIRTRWYVLLSGVALFTILLVAVGYLLPVLGQPATGASTDTSLEAKFVPSPTLTAAPVSSVESATVVPPAASLTPTTVRTSAPTVTPMMTRPSIEQPAAAPTTAPTENLTPVATVLATLELPAPPQEPTHTASPPPTPTRRPLATRVPATITQPSPAGIQKIVRLDAPEGAFKDIRGNQTLHGLAIQCLGADSTPLADRQGIPILLALKGTEGTYTLPEGTKRVVLWVDMTVYGEWWNHFDAQAVDVTAQDVIVLRVVGRSQVLPVKTLPSRR